MSKVSFDYPHIEYAQDLFNMITKNYEKFDWTWLDWDWKKNWLATIECLQEYERELRTLPIILVYYNKTSDSNDDYFDALYYEPRLHTYVSCGELDGSDNRFDYQTPLDVLSLLDDLIARAEEIKSFYQIKPA